MSRVDTIHRTAVQALDDDPEGSILPPAARAALVDIARLSERELEVMSRPMYRALAEVVDEYDRATHSNGDFHSPHEGFAVIDEERDELWDEVKANRGRMASARLEAKQVAAMGLRYMVDLTEPADG